jgi:hypothetical protein
VWLSERVSYICFACDEIVLFCICPPQISYQPTMWAYIIIICACPGTGLLTSVSSGALGYVFPYRTFAAVVFLTFVIVGA